MSQGSSPIYGHRSGTQPNAVLQALMRSGAGFSAHERNCAYLNLGQAGFANVSGISGLDFPDDGRAIGVVDWDRDGDLDLWFKNRSGPQLRLMENRLGNQKEWVSLRLEGTNCNRDAIGARVEIALYPTGADNTPENNFAVKTLTKTLRAGEGFLSQCSKWMHFGLGMASEIEDVVVHWPGGGAESFGPLAPRKRYVLVQGRGQATPAPTTPTENLHPGPLMPPRLSQPNRIVLSQPMPIPTLPYTDAKGNVASIGAGDGNFQLLALWSSQCAPCLKELKALGERRQQILDAGLDVVALCTDQIALNNSNLRRVEQIMARLNFSGQYGFVEPQAMDQLQLINEWVYFRTSKMPLPISFLLDERGELRAIYRGPIHWELLASDMDAIRNNDSLRHWAVPFRGRWRLPERPHRPLWVASRLLEFGDLPRAVDFIRANQKLAEMDEDYGPARLRLGMLLLSTDRIASSQVELRAAMERMPDSVDVHVALGTVEYLLGNVDRARNLFARSRLLDADRADELLRQASAELRRRGVSISVPQ